MSNTKEIATMDDLKRKIAERIKNSFVELIPEEAWRGVVEKEIGHFTTPETGYGKPQPSPLQKLIRNEIEIRFKTMIEEELDQPQYNTFSPDGVSDFVKEVVRESAPRLIENMFGDIVSRAIIAVKNDLARY